MSHLVAQEVIATSKTQLCHSSCTAVEDWGWRSFYSTSIITWWCWSCDTLEDERSFLWLKLLSHLKPIKSIPFKWQINQKTSFRKLMRSDGQNDKSEWWIPRVYSAGYFLALWCVFARHQHYSMDNFYVKIISPLEENLLIMSTGDTLYIGITFGPDYNGSTTG